MRDDKSPFATEAILARDGARHRKEVYLLRTLDRLKRTAIVRPMRPEDEEAVSNARVEMTDASANVVAPLIEALDILQAIIYASDGCVGHRQCGHSMEPWQRARDLLHGLDR